MGPAGSPASPSGAEARHLARGFEGARGGLAQCALDAPEPKFRAQKFQFIYGSRRCECFAGPRESARPPMLWRLLLRRKSEIKLSRQTKWRQRAAKWPHLELRRNAVITRCRRLAAPLATLCAANTHTLDIEWPPLRRHEPAPAPAKSVHSIGSSCERRRRAHQRASLFAPARHSERDKID